MSPGHFRIPGHSGTDFKYRKAFAKIKELQQEKIPARSSTAVRPTVPYRSAYSSHSTTHWVFQLIGILLTLGIVITLGYLIISGYYRAHKATISTYEARQERLRVESQRAYRILVDTGNDYLINGELEQAHIEFAQALRIDGYGKDARVGLTKALVLRCQIEGKYCAAADENLTYVLKMKYGEAAEFDYIIPIVTP